MTNHLADETSPYLLEHAHNPVDWYPWGAEALARARAEERPIFLSIGYSACHWCHVMERESFENDAIARLMNDNFVCIKVDREERPDLDQIYMSAVQMMTGRGGWPMSVFLTPDQKPFYGGTYWPPQARMGMPGFDQVLQAVASAWHERRPQALEQAEMLTEHLAQGAAIPTTGGALDRSLVDSAASAILRSFDPTHGGFSAAPKFPHSMDMRLLLRVWKEQGADEALRAVTFTLDKMAGGGIHDQLRGGFHRYSVDERWLVPHFEKMLYDNGLLVPCFVEAYQITGSAEYARVVRETCDYVLAEMTDPRGGFYSAQDADSEGEEGKFFVWRPEEIAEILGADAAAVFCRAYDVTADGNFEHGQSILNLPRSLAEIAHDLGRDARELESELAASRRKLLAVRNGRVHPRTDDKVLVGWNGLMIEALALAGGALGEPSYLAAARRAARFLLDEVRRPDGRLLHSWRAGRAKLDAYQDDYAAMIGALVALYEADFDERWIDEAIGLAETMLRLFSDEQGGFYFTANDHEALITRQKELIDNATPSGNALAACHLLRLGRLTGRNDFVAACERTLLAAEPLMRQAPRATAQMLIALDMFTSQTSQIVILGEQGRGVTRDLLATIRRQYLPNKLLACRAAGEGPARSSALALLFAGKTLSGAEPGVFVCENFTCGAPVFGEAALALKL